MFHRILIVADGSDAGMDADTVAVIVAPAGYRNVFARREPAVLVP